MRNRILVFIAAIAITFSTVGCEPVYTGPENGRKVAIIGDSITAWSSDAINASFSGYALNFKATPGINIPDGKTQLIEPALAGELPPSVMLVELGVNSAGNNWDNQDKQDLTDALEVMRSVPCVVWVVPTAMAPAPLYDPLGTGYIRDRIETMKASMRIQFQNYPNVKLADWRPAQDLHPEWYHADRMHLSDSGKIAYAAYLKNRLETLC